MPVAKFSGFQLGKRSKPMGKTIAEFTMSLDGFIADPNDDVRRLMGWYFSGDTEMTMGDGMVFKVSQASADLLRESWGAIGAIVTGRRDFDVSRAWGGKSPIAGAQILIVTHTVPQEWAGKESPFTFVTDGVESALAQAKAIAGEKNVAVSGSKITQQCLQAGLLDEIQIELAPILLGAGVRLFEGLDTAPIDLEKILVLDTPNVTHLKYRVVK
jgi:dihydrofolate reductase